MLLGAVLAPCNVYSGLKIGWSFNMSIAALLLGYMFWVPLTRWFGGQKWDLLESNISQTTASSAASIISGGLVAPLPALAMIEGDNLPLGQLIPWVFAVSFFGIWVGWYLRGRLVVAAGLPFPAGMATAETMLDIFSRGATAARRVVMLLSSLAAALAVNFVDKVVWALPRWAPTATAKQYTFMFDPSLLLLGFGSIIGLRAGLGLLLGALLAWGLVAPLLVSAGDVQLAAGGDSFQALVGWLLWPGVALMLTSSLVSLGFALLRAGPDAAAVDDPEHAAERRLRLGGCLAAAALVIALQIVVFDIHWTMALLAVPLAFVLALVAARVTGETGIPPVGAIGKLSQLTFGVLAPLQTTTNLMTANVAGGAAGQCADLLNDLKAGQAVGARPARQIAAQCLGVLTGSVVGSLVYVSLIERPREQLLTAEWPAPAVATWKAVAETLSAGLDSVPVSALWAMLVASLVGAVLAVLERRLRPALLRWVPSGASLGLAFVVPASTSITLFLGALLGALLSRLAPGWSRVYLLSVAAGLVAGESLFGVAAVWF
jgi:uncharacterized oligopeptide transporter (OPT) family protein